MRPAAAEPSIWIQPPRAVRRPALSQAAIVRTAIRVADDGGLPAFTMQAVAHALGNFTPMALYRYVYSKEGLVDLMLDAVLAEAAPSHDSKPTDTPPARRARPSRAPAAGRAPPRAAADWRVEVLDLELRTWAAIMRHPWFAQLVHTRPPLGPNALRRTEYLLGVFHGLGADLGTAMGYVSLVERLVIGLALQAGEEARAELAIDITQPQSAYAALDPLRALTAATDAYPLLAGWAAAPRGPTAQAQLELGLGMVLDGIAARHRGQGRSRSRMGR